MKETLQKMKGTLQKIKETLQKRSPINSTKINK
jgi:hypothetical protein